MNRRRQTPPIFHPAPRKDRRKTRRKARRGSVLFLAVGLVMTLLAVSVLAVDWGVRQVAAGELQGATDAAALYGVRGLDTSYQAAEARVYAALADNPVRGRLVPKSAVTVEFGLWDPKLRAFAPLTGPARNSATALRVKVRLVGADAVSTPFASGVGLGKMPVAARATAARGEPFNIDVDAKASPYLAGMPNGSKVKFEGKTKLSWSKDTDAPESTPVGVHLPRRPRPDHLLPRRAGQHRRPQQRRDLRPGGQTPRATRSARPPSTASTRPPPRSTA